MKYLIKNQKQEIIGLKLTKYLVTARYYVGYGANLKRLRSVKNRTFEILANRPERAIMIAETKSKLQQGLSAGWIFSAKKSTK